MARIVTSNNRQRQVIRDLRAENVYSFDYDNAYPQRVYDLVNSSGAAKSAWDKFAKFIMGNGVSDDLVARQVVNKYGITVDKLMRMCINDYAMFRGFSVHVSYNAMGDITGFNHVPFEWCRIGRDQKIAVYDNWDRRKLKDNGKYSPADIRRFDKFDPDYALDEINAEPGATLEDKIANYPGQVFWFSADGIETYPLSPFDPVLEDIETDAEIKIGKLKNVKTNFVAPQMVKYRGRFESDQDRASFIESLEQFQGNENVGNIMLVEVEDGVADFEVAKFEIQDFDKKWEFTERSVKENIFQALQQPLVLSAMPVAGKLGTSSEIEDAKIFYNEITADDRLVISEEFTRLFGRKITILGIDETGEIANSATDVNVAATALNGAQISSLNEIIANVTGGIYPADTGRAIIAASFPFLTAEQINDILQPLTNGTTANNPV
jgi:hypothetical protein